MLAIDGGAPIRTGPWPSWPVWDEAEERALLEVLHSGHWWSFDGNKVPEFEQKFAVFQDARHAICVTNGTAALEVALRAMGIGCGDEVIVPPYTFIATASSVLACSATPVFVDVQPDSLNMDPAQIESAITRRTKAIVPVHIAGGPADMDGIMAIALKHGIRVVEDAAQAVAAEWNGRKVGAIGDCGTFSFQASKNLNGGEGGIIITNDDDLADKVWSVANVGRSKTGAWYEHHVLGGNFRMTEWQAAILLCQMQRLPEQTQRRTENARLLDSLLGEIPGIRVLRRDTRITRHAYHLYIFRYDAAAFGGRSRQEFLQALKAEGIPASAGYVPLYKEIVFQRKAACQGSWCQAGRPIDYPNLNLPVCEQVCQDSVWLFQSLLLAEPDDMQQVAAAIRKVQAAWSK